MNKFMNYNNQSRQIFNCEASITKQELDLILNQSNYPSKLAEGKETVLWSKDSLYNCINTNLAKAKEVDRNNPEMVDDLLSRYNKWVENRAPMDKNCAEFWERVRKKPIVNDVIKEEQNLSNSNIIEYNEILHANKETVLSGLQKIPKLAPDKPLGSAGDITINELITKGFEVIDTPLVKMIRENVDVSVVGGYISAMILYKSVVNLFVKSAYSKSLPDIIKAPSTRTREIALFMLLGAPFVVGCMWTGGLVFGGKVVVNLNANANNELEGIDSVNKTEIEGTSTISSNSLFLFLNKLPSWLKIILKYLALYFIGLFVVKVIGYNSNIIV